MQRHVSVIIPVFNRAGPVVEAIDSVLSQQGVDVQVVVVDDGSTDDSFDVVKEIAATDGRVIADALPQNSGVAVARNRAFELATCGVVTFLDSDDLMTPGRLLRQLDVLEDQPEAIVTGCQQVSVQQGAELPASMEAQAEQGLSPYTMTMCASRETFDRVGRFDPGYRIGEDLEYLLRSKAMGIPIVKLDDALVIRRIFGDNLVGDFRGVQLGILRAVRQHQAKPDEK